MQVPRLDSEVDYNNCEIEGFYVSAEDKKKISTKEETREARRSRRNSNMASRESGGYYYDTQNWSKHKGKGGGDTEKAASGGKRSLRLHVQIHSEEDLKPACQGSHKKILFSDFFRNTVMPSHPLPIWD